MGMRCAVPLRVKPDRRVLGGAVLLHAADERIYVSDLVIPV